MDHECKLAEGHGESEHSVREEHEWSGFLVQLMDFIEAQAQMVDEIVTCVSQVPITRPSWGASGTAFNVKGKEYLTPSGSEEIPCSAQRGITTVLRN